MKIEDLIIELANKHLQLCDHELYDESEQDLRAIGFTDKASDFIASPFVNKAKNKDYSLKQACNAYGKENVANYIIDLLAHQEDIEYIFENIFYDD